RSRLDIAQKVMEPFNSRLDVVDIGHSRNPPELIGRRLGINVGRALISHSATLRALGRAELPDTYDQQCKKRLAPYWISVQTHAMPTVSAVSRQLKLLRQRAGLS